jgi:hypothetical protein
MDVPNLVGKQLDAATAVMNKNHAQLLAFRFQLVCRLQRRLRRVVKTHFGLAAYPDLSREIRLGNRTAAVHGIADKRHRSIVPEACLVIEPKLLRRLLDKMIVDEFIHFHIDGRFLQNS